MVFLCTAHNGLRLFLNAHSSDALQSLTGKYRGLQGNTCNENRDPAMRTGVLCNENSFSLWELAHREFPVSYTGFGFADPDQ